MKSLSAASVIFSAALDQAFGSKATAGIADAVLLLAEIRDDGASSENQQTAQISFAGLRDTAQPCLATIAVLARRQTEPCGHLASIPELMFGTQPRKQATGRRRSDAAQLHEPLTTRILMRDFSDCAIVPNSCLLCWLSISLSLRVVEELLAARGNCARR
jgi:hypothetical protein